MKSVSISPVFFPPAQNFTAGTNYELITDFNNKISETFTEKLTWS